MPEIKLPYGEKKLSLELPEERLEGVLVSQAHDYVADLCEEELVKEALKNPINSPQLRELAVGKDNIVVISSDHTRPVPSHVTMPIILDEIRAGNPEAEITILIATGFHRASTEEELRHKYGDDIVDNETIINHDSRDQDSMVHLGTLPSGGDLILNKLAVDADLLIAEGFIEPHFFAGFSGGRKSVLPGVASKMTVLANHCSEFIGHNKARTGILDGNPLHRDMLYAAEQANLEFILNVVINEDKEVINAFAGHREEAHAEGCQFVAELSGAKAKPAEIVITTNGGYPLDQNIYQSVKGMTAGEATCKEGGVIIIAAECSDGHGGEAFYKTFAEADSVQQVMDEIEARDRKDTIPDQWESQVLARLLLQFEVIMVTDAPREMVEDMSMHWAADLNEALEMAEKILDDSEARITVIPDGVSVTVSK
ncbi:nickel-dependent lactate racemase [Natroniella sulfidigena]|uniref:nickel-dependent lactate racemase n=1 Tax=Natroniella sulfidigena TaxID=723921 RepID=UPI00200A508A|nr:nickel-dependent lactate racemase [Natroniella sulfidigena]MCK8817008.1 nickel-dependent lactate racemase [Natroniella sulfidigena]